MSVAESHTAVFVETAARLHFGILDLRGAAGRWFGGVGAGAPGPTLLVSAESSDGFEITGPDAARAAGFARRYLASHDLDARVKVQVHRMLPPHSGLGSGTQLALAVARALAELHDLPGDARLLTQDVGRARRSAVGTWTFAGGGLVVEGGRRRDDGACGPLLARLPFPAEWRCIVVVPRSDTRGLSGVAEEAAFENLPLPPEQDAERVAHLILMSLLPALVDDDLETFGRALTDMQRLTGCWFSSIQGGIFARGASEDLIRLLAEWGAVGVGQSSWGPAVYGIVRGDDPARRIAERLRDRLHESGDVFVGPFRAGGARVWRGAPAEVERRTSHKV